MEKSFRRLSNEAGAPAGAPNSKPRRPRPARPTRRRRRRRRPRSALLQRRGVGGAGPSGLVAASDAAGYPSPASHHGQVFASRGGESGRATCGDGRPRQRRWPVAAHRRDLPPPSALPTLFGRCGGGGRSGSGAAALDLRQHGPMLGRCSLGERRRRRRRAPRRRGAGRGRRLARTLARRARRAPPPVPVGPSAAASGSSVWRDSAAAPRHRRARVRTPSSTFTMRRAAIRPPGGARLARRRPPRGRRSSLSPVVGSLPARSPPARPRVCSRSGRARRARNRWWTTSTSRPGRAPRRRPPSAVACRIPPPGCRPARRPTPTRRRQIRTSLGDRRAARVFEPPRRGGAPTA